MKFQNEFNYYLETLGLLAHSNDFQNSKSGMISELNSLGFTGDKMYDAHFMSWEKVIVEFDNQKIINENYNFFFDETGVKENKFLLVLTLLVSEYSEQNKEKKLLKEDLQNILIQIICTVLEQEQKEQDVTILDFYKYLQPLPFSESEKWKLFSCYQAPVETMANLLELIENNLKICKEIYRKHGIEKFISKTARTLNESDYTDLAIIRLGNELPIYPMFANPLVQLVLESKGYVGVLIFDVFKKGEFTKEIDDDTLMKLKSLSDRSKFQILIYLKDQSMYSLELANVLDLSAGTVSHHMSTLLQTGLVSVEKQSGKVYYQLNSQAVEKLVERLNTLLI